MVSPTGLASQSLAATGVDMTIASDARNLLRDFRKCFEQVFDASMQSTLHLSPPARDQPHGHQLDHQGADAATGPTPWTSATACCGLSTIWLLTTSGITVGGCFTSGSFGTWVHARFGQRAHMMSRGPGHHGR